MKTRSSISLRTAPPLERQILHMQTTYFQWLQQKNGLQRKANVVSTCAIVLGLKIAQAKLRVFSMDWTALPLQRSRLPQEYLTVHAMGGTAHTLPIKNGGSVKSLGVHYDMDASGKTQRDLSTQELNGLLAAFRHRKATPDTIKAVLESSVIAKIADRGVLSGWSLKFSLELD